MGATVHAGEEGLTEFITEALGQLDVDRVDHDIRSIDDFKVVARLAQRQVPLTVCPVSKVKLKVFSALEHHDAERLLEARGLITLNTDDPSYFRANLMKSISDTAAALNLYDEQVFQTIANGFKGAFCVPETRHTYLASLQKFWFS